MMLAASIVLSLLLTLACAAATWPARRVGRVPLAATFLAGVALLAVGAATAAPLYPWANVAVILVALAGGLLLGRAMPARLRPYLALLVALSLLDVAQIALTSGSPPPGPTGGPGPAPLLYGNVTLLLPWGRFRLGILDLLLATATAEHLRRRGRSLALALTPGAVELLLAAAVVVAAGRGGLPLIPFLTVGYLAAEALHRRAHRPAPGRDA